LGQAVEVNDGCLGRRALQLLCRKALELLRRPPSQL
jgi:hypothetical protein